MRDEGAHLMKKWNTWTIIACLGALAGGAIRAGDVTTTGGTANTIPVFTGLSAIGNSIMTQSGSTVTVDGALNAATIQLGGTTSLFDNPTTYTLGVGDGVLTSLTTGRENTGVGPLALEFTTTGSENTAVGPTALYENTSGSYNVGVGPSALRVGNGSYNTAVGAQAGQSTTGTGNTLLGYNAGVILTTGNYNIDIGYQVEGATTDSGVIRIGSSNQTSAYLAGVYGVTTASTGVEVFIDSAGQLGTKSSSIRYKQDVHDMDEASDGLFRLRPVTFRYKQPFADGSTPIDYGLIAEEVAGVYPDMVARNAQGQIETVQYSKLTPMLLNEVQKQHQEMEEQQRLLEKQAEMIRLLEKRLAALEQASPGAK
jgi:hypothetical protein